MLVVWPTKPRRVRGQLAPAVVRCTGLTVHRKPCAVPAFLPPCHDQIYYVFGFLYVVFFILIATCAEITMVMCYFQLCNEDYRW